jgi:hypothetical protein
MCEDTPRIAMDIDLLAEEVTLFGIQFQVWHFIYLATGTLAVIYAIITGR